MKLYAKCGFEEELKKQVRGFLQFIFRTALHIQFLSFIRQLNSCQNFNSLKQINDKQPTPQGQLSYFHALAD